MPSRIAFQVSSLLLLSSMVCSSALAQSSVEERLQRLERVLSSDTLIELLQQVERLQQEVQELRGELELQSYELSTLKKSQTDLYLDLDERMKQAEERAQATETDEVSAEGTSEGGTETVNADPAKERDTYQSAFELLKTRRYDQAIAALSVFLQEYPNGEYSDNARYWLGEAYYVTQSFDAALAEFRTLLETEPDSPKVSDALLKIGYIHDDLGRYEAAASTLNEVIEKYPGSNAATFAKERLAQMEN